MLGIRGMGSGIRAVGFGQWGLGSGVWAVGFGQWGLGSGVWAVGLGCITSVMGFESEVWGLRFRV
jgi:hypothetical protein